MLRPKNILVPTDFSDYSDKALKQALDIAKDYHSQVYLLHVIGEHTIQTVEEYSIDVEIIKQLDDQLLSNAKEKMQKELEKYNKSATYLMKRFYEKQMIKKLISLSSHRSERQA
jgi:universal stress protein A